MPGGTRRHSALRIAAWTLIGPSGCSLVAAAYSAMTFAGLGNAAVYQSVVNAVVLPFALGLPLFLYVSLKLSELAEANHKLGIVAATDGLTECLNRRAFTTLVDTRLGALPARPGHVVGALLVIDADRFKDINDTFGHQKGDAALALIAGAIRNSVRAGDNVGRLGGEEFGVFLPGVDRPAADAVAERLRCAVAGIEFIVGGKSHQLSVSVGGVVFDQWASFEALFGQADANLYTAKKSGRNRVCLAGFDLEGLAPAPQ